MRVVYWLGFIIRVPIAILAGLCLFGPVLVIMASFKPRQAADDARAIWEMFLTILLGES